eukprot:SAG31_NODE_43120_length_268_cov_0.917160_1_plen_64_part_01
MLDLPATTGEARVTVIPEFIMTLRPADARTMRRPWRLLVVHAKKLTFKCPVGLTELFLPCQPSI